MRRAVIVAWSPAAVLAACLAASALAGAAGYRTLERAADAQLALAGGYVAHHVQTVLASRLRALEGVAAMDPRADGPADRSRRRQALIDSLVRLHPELSWVGFVEPPGRVAVAYRDPLAGEDVSGRHWWSAALIGPYLGEARPATPAPPRPEAVAVGDPPEGPGPAADAARPIDLAVPLRTAAGDACGVLAAQLDARWVLELRDEAAAVAGSLAGVEVLVLRRDGSAVAAHRIGLDPPGGPGEAIRSGTLDGRPATFAVLALEGDVVVSRLGWRVAVGRDRQSHEAPARRFLAWSVAGGALVGLAVAAALALAADGARARTA